MYEIMFAEIDCDEEKCNTKVVATACLCKAGADISPLLLAGVIGFESPKSQVSVSLFYRLDKQHVFQKRQ